MVFPSRGARDSIAHIRKNGRCLRPIFFMRIRTATIVSYQFSVFSSPAAPWPLTLLLLPQLLLAFFLQLGPLFRRESLAGVALHFGHFRAGIEHAALLQVLQGLHSLPHPLAGH